MNNIENNYMVAWTSCVQILRILENGDQLNYLLNSDGPIVKAVAKFFYLANLMHSSVNMN